jgi:hypothetical protein
MSSLPAQSDIEAHKPEDPVLEILERLQMQPRREITISPRPMTVTTSAMKQGGMVASDITETNTVRGVGDPIRRHRLTGPEHVPSAHVVTVKGRVRVVRPKATRRPRTRRRTVARAARSSSDDPGPSDPSDPSRRTTTAAEAVSVVVGAVRS